MHLRLPSTMVGRAVNRRVMKNKIEIRGIEKFKICDVSFSFVKNVRVRIDGTVKR